MGNFILVKPISTSPYEPMCKNTVIHGNLLKDWQQCDVMRRDQFYDNYLPGRTLGNMHFGELKESLEAKYAGERRNMRFIQEGIARTTDRFKYEMWLLRSGESEDSELKIVSTALSEDMNAQQVSLETMLENSKIPVIPDGTDLVDLFTFDWSLSWQMLSMESKGKFIFQM